MVIQGENPCLGYEALSSQMYNFTSKDALEIEFMFTKEEQATYANIETIYT